VGVTRTVDAARIGKRQIGAALLQFADMGVDADLLAVGEVIPSGAELIRVFDWPYH